MGADQSSTGKSSSEREKISKDEMGRLLRQQKILFEQKYAELLRAAKAQQQNTSAAQETAREEARKEVARIMEQKQEQLIRQNAKLNDYPLKTSTAFMPSSSSIPDRDRSPYTCAGSALTSPTLAPASTQSTTLYPNLSNNASSFEGNTPTLPATPLPTNNNNITTPPDHPSTSRNSRDHDRVFNNYPQSVLTSLPRAPTDVPVPSAPPQPRNRSISRSRRNNTEGDGDLSCPTCKNRYDGNIYQCSRGHSSCRHCKLQSRPCGAWVSRRVLVCGLPITDMRNITLEAYNYERSIYCPNSEEGCCMYIKLAEIEAHLKECPFREMQCPLESIFGQCSWKGKLSQTAEHFDSVHQMHRTGDVDTEMVLLNTARDNHIVYLVVLGTYNFLFHAKVSTQYNKLYMAVQLMGTHNNAAKWNYEIHIYNKRQPRRKYQYTEICRSANSSIFDVFAQSDCAAIPLAYANTFVNEGCLTYKFFIKKEAVPQNFPQNQRGRGGARRRYGRTIHQN